MRVPRWALSVVATVNDPSPVLLQCTASLPGTAERVKTSTRSATMKAL